ncbi:MAG TPA: VOC family protein [Candidatus Binatia bacterium]|jgi:catechol 2,3-dioxygenase-like lactoylglutathione lyase family enzyme
MAFRINHIHIKTRDPKKTAEWFVKNLGAKIAAENRNGDKIAIRLDLHGLGMNVTDFLDEQKLAQHYGMEHLAIDTDDIFGEIENLKAAGVRILEERNLPDGRHVCFFEGPEGVRLEVMEWRK